MSKSRAFGLVYDEQAFVFDTGITFRGMSITQKEDGWNVVVRGVDGDKTPVYCMSFGDTPDGALQQLVETWKSKESKYLWRFDGWAR